jgi:hypothetical protein
MKILPLLIVLFALTFMSCNNSNQSAETKEANEQEQKTEQKKEYLSQPLVSHIYTADPSAHVFNGRIYIYPSHDTATGTKEDNLGSHFDMRGLSCTFDGSCGQPVTDHGIALDIKNIPWAGRQLWAPDAAFANNTYYLYFPVKTNRMCFVSEVATSPKPEGPLLLRKNPSKGVIVSIPAYSKMTMVHSICISGNLGWAVAEMEQQ